METRPAWPLDELMRRVALALRSSPGARPPDARAVRWYASIGLVDRPVGGRGRGARYGVRHLRQLVAVRRLQADGWSLADIQGRLAGADDDTLSELAALPEQVDAVAAEPVHVEPVHVEPVHAEPVHAEPVHAEPVHAEPEAVPGPPRAASRADLQFWRPGSEAVVALERAPHELRAVGAVELAAGVVLVLPRRPSATELPALAAAAEPLVAALIAFGLVARPSSTVPGGPS